MFELHIHNTKVATITF